MQDSLSRCEINGTTAKTSWNSQNFFKHWHVVNCFSSVTFSLCRSLCFNTFCRKTQKTSSWQKGSVRWYFLFHLFFFSFSASYSAVGEKVKKKSNTWSQIKQKLHLSDLFFTFNHKFSRTLHSAVKVFCYDCIVSTVLWPHFEYDHGADPTCVSDVVVGVGVQANAVFVPGHIGFGVPRHCTTHVALVALWTGACLERNQKWRSHLKITAFGGGHIQAKLFWKRQDTKIIKWNK